MRVLPAAVAATADITGIVITGIVITVALVTAGAAQGPSPRFERRLDVARAGEQIIVIRAGCARCDWGIEGREAAVLKISVDGRYSQHLALARGEEAADYPIGLGPLTAGTHQLTIERDPPLSAPGAGAATIEVSSTNMLQPGPDYAGSSIDYVAQSMAPILYARANTVGKFTDLPLLMWYETAPTPRGREYRYSVIFSNEDGGTATDRLMATWGRTTDIEFVYGVELDQAGKLLHEEFQGPGHEVPVFHGKREGAHPLLWVSTDNNMVSESGSTTIRYAPVPKRFDLHDVSREVVMDDSPWTYVVAAKEMAREHKVDDAAVAGSGRIPDPRRFVHVEACTELKNAAVAFSVHARSTTGAAQWYDSDRGLAEFRIVRSGCFRGAVPLPADAAAPDAIRFRAFAKPKPEAGVRPSVILTRVNQVFTIGQTFLPGTSLFSWLGSRDLRIDGDWVELPFRR